MSRVEVVDFKSFCKGDVIPIRTKPGIVSLLAGGAVPASGWDQLWPQALQIADWMCLGVIVFAGGTWMFGNRTRSLELLLGGCIGYEIIRHAWDILHWLQKI